jgi:DNA modification methylase
MKPYFEDEHVKIYHGDCRELLPAMPKVDLVLTDPPYGINRNTDLHGFSTLAKAAKGYAITHPQMIQNDGTADVSSLFTFPRCIIWGANNFHHLLPQGGQWLVWDKRADNGHALLNDAEMAWRSSAGGIRVFTHCWHGFARASENSMHFHPTQKPLALMRWCLGLVKDVRTVIDPYMGSGTTLRAAKDIGIKAIGIEIEERYCEIAARRMAQQVLDFETIGG